MMMPGSTTMIKKTEGQVLVSINIFILSFISLFH